MIDILYCAIISIVMYKISKPDNIGQYHDPNAVKPFTDSYLVEASINLPDSVEYHSAAKALREFADQLKP
jgi:hypothetical protein